MTVSTVTPTVRFATEDERAQWNTLIAQNPDGGQVWQGEEYLEVKRLGRYTPIHLVVELPNRAPMAVGVLSKQVRGLGEWWHIPAGPSPETGLLEELISLVDAVATFARKRGAFLLKIEPRIAPSQEWSRHALAQGWVQGARIIPNPSTVLVDVSGSEEELWKRIGKKARNSINRARRDGIEVTRVPSDETHASQFSTLLTETAEGKFVMRQPSYYHEFWRSYAESGNGQMFFAMRDGELLAAAYATQLGHTSTYKDGASLKEKKAYGASHLLQWEVLRWAQERGALSHDLCGAPPSDRLDDTSHPLHGVGRFKRSFQPQVTDYVGLFDVPLKPLKYSLWRNVVERISRRISLRVHHDPYY